MNIYILHYGFDYEHDTILGAYSSYYLAKKAKKEYIEITENCYDYYNIQTFVLDDKKDNNE